MKLVLSVFLWGCFFSQVQAQPLSSAYDRLRLQFIKAELPSVESLHTGSIWYCSDSLEAAKGQYSRVATWYPKFVFQKDLFENLVQVHLFSANKNKELAFSPLRVQVSSSKNIFFRIGPSGQLLVEEVDLSANHSSLKTSVSEKAELASHYWLCESPSTHDFWWEK